MDKLDKTVGQLKVTPIAPWHPTAKPQKFYMFHIQGASVKTYQLALDYRKHNLCANSWGSLWVPTLWLYTFHSPLRTYHSLCQTLTVVDIFVASLWFLFDCGPAGMTVVQPTEHRIRCSVLVFPFGVLCSGYKSQQSLMQQYCTNECFCIFEIWLFSLYCFDPNLQLLPPLAFVWIAVAKVVLTDLSCW